VTIACFPLPWVYLQLCDTSEDGSASIIRCTTRKDPNHLGSMNRDNLERWAASYLPPPAIFNILTALGEWDQL
jgi:hypothetical protein